MERKEFKIFILDDDEYMRDFVIITLAKSGYINVEAFEYADQLLVSMNNDVKLVIIDVKLNEAMDGFDVLDKLKVTHPHVYFVMLSGLKSYEILKKFCQRYRRGDFIDKDEKDLASCINQSVEEVYNDIILMSKFYKDMQIVKEGAQEIKRIIKNKRDVA